jgi:hypothetical protein
MEFSGGYLGILRRSDLLPGVAPRVFAAEPGEVVGPDRIGNKHTLYLILDKRPASLRQEIREEIADLLFEQWMDEHLGAACRAERKRRHRP